jgi:hypothetical protein
MYHLLNLTELRCTGIRKFPETCSVQLDVSSEELLLRKAEFIRPLA